VPCKFCSKEEFSGFHPQRRAQRSPSGDPEEDSLTPEQISYPICVKASAFELELELSNTIIQTQMTQKPMLWAEV
jgi:hypothetical protein